MQWHTFLACFIFVILQAQSSTTDLRVLACIQLIITSLSNWGSWVVTTGRGEKLHRSVARLPPLMTERWAQHRENTKQKHRLCFGSATTCTSFSCYWCTSTHIEASWRGGALIKQNINNKVAQHKQWREKTKKNISKKMCEISKRGIYNSCQCLWQYPSHLTMLWQRPSTTAICIWEKNIRKTSLPTSHCRS